MILAEACRASLLASSYSRIDVVMTALGQLPRLDWFALLGSEWPSCDNLYRWRSDLRRMLRSASRSELAAMMEPAERAGLESLPAQLTVYRGCYRLNWSGLAWTLDRQVAERFPALMRYRRDGEQALLLTGVVTRERAVLKLDRDEQEIISGEVRVISGAGLPRVALEEAIA